LLQVKFSILLDESTDIATQKQLCVVVRYVSPNSGKIVSTLFLLELVEMDARDLSARAIYQTFKGVLEKFEIPIHNILGMASDGASVMVGKHNSFFTLI
jgi:hypothetical protein